MEGVLLINKPQNLTSRDVINKLNRILGTKKIGHTGTLDPLATGVLVCCVGKYTKLVNLITAYDKVYVVEIKLGIKTDTGDITGKVIEEKKFNVTKEMVEQVLISFKKKYIQTIPKYSAVSVNGKRLYQYAREEIEVELPTREVEIYDISLIEFHDDIIKFKVKVSKGTYIRSLIEDICDKLNTVGTMYSLVRIKQGDFEIENTYTLEDVDNNNYKLLNVVDIFSYPKIEIDDEVYFKVKNGAKLDNIYSIEDKVMFVYQGKCVAIYEVKDNYLKSFIQL